jgi:hypothetical protein
MMERQKHKKTVKTRMSEFTNLMLSDQDDVATTKWVQIGHITQQVHQYMDDRNLKFLEYNGQTNLYGKVS